MNPTISAWQRKLGKHGHTWEASAEEQLSCLYRCEHCGKTVLAPVIVKADVANPGCKTRKAAEQAAAGYAQRVLSEIKNPESRRIPDLENVTFSFPQKCAGCRQSPVWAGQMEQVNQRSAFREIMSLLLFSLLLALLLYVIKAAVSPGSKTAAALLTVLSIALCIAGMVLGPPLIRRRLKRKAASLIEASLDATLPLFFETREELETQARSVSLYRDLPPGSLWARAEKEPDGFIVQA